MSKRRMAGAVAGVTVGMALLVNASFAQTNAALKIERITLENEQIARFSVSGPPYSAFVIEASPDWKKWSILSFTNAVLPPLSIEPPQQVIFLAPIFCLSPEGRLEEIGAPRQGPALFYRLRATNGPPPIVLTKILRTPTPSQPSPVPNPPLHRTGSSRSSLVPIGTAVAAAPGQ